MKAVAGYLWLLVLISLCFSVKSKCPKTCDLALASFYVWPGSTLTLVADLFDSSAETIVDYNSGRIPNKDSVRSDIRINIPFACDRCVADQYLAHEFGYKVIGGDTYERVVSNYSSLTTVQSLIESNPLYDPNNIPDTGNLNVSVNCSCGNSQISKEFGLFITYPLRPNDTLDSIATSNNISADWIRRYNPDVLNFSQGSGIIFFPGKGLKGGVIAIIVVAAVVGVLLLAAGIYYKFYRKVDGKLISSEFEDQSSHHLYGPESSSDKAAVTPRKAGGLAGITVDKSVEFSYEELAKASDNFSLANKIGQGGFGAVYYAELRGEKAAIKKMDMEASKEFLAELKVLTRVHHLNLVRLIGYCVEGSLFLVYEFIENGNLSQHLRGSEREPMPWSTRVQIALDSARGLEYIHEHTVPVYIHRDIKSANILIDKNFHAKVADFGLTKLTEVGGSSLPTRLVGTFGYMPPEYAQYGDVSPKVDVYAFGVVIYELISAKEAIVKPDGSGSESKGLVGLFEDVLNQPDFKDLRKLIDPRLGENYPVDSVRKMAQLAKACTHENPQLRPSMRSIVVALMTLSSNTEDWDVGSFYENQGLVNLMSGR
ncbi:chitin elicitor receptor kinase 1-like isoform X1 [Humulus lupulus]|uniref:chitin elicitor receptor kinase 1-like isoform X1 n=1 Tax=Humulus lupulus TaxID=3486 RepID=UPI002B4160B8|nr:chitin elicitor receptor kinase 1-like isoform X1 [Humulus lupulus]